MRRSNPKLSFYSGFSVTMKILSLIVLGCVLVFFGLAYAEGDFENDTNDPCVEHPWDDIGPGFDPPLPKLADRCDVKVLPVSDFGGWIIIHFSPVKEKGKDRVQIQTSSKNQSQFLILF